MYIYSRNVHQYSISFFYIPSPGFVIPYGYSFYNNIRISIYTSDATLAYWWASVHLSPTAIALSYCTYPSFVELSIENSLKIIIYILYNALLATAHAHYRKTTTYIYK